MKKGNSGGTTSGHSDGSTEHESNLHPTEVDPNAEQNLLSLRDSISKGNRLSQG